MLSHTRTEWAPWHVVPADHRWLGRLTTAAVLIRALAEANPQYPLVTTDVPWEMAAARSRVSCRNRKLSISAERASPIPHGPSGACRGTWRPSAPGQILSLFEWGIDFVHGLLEPDLACPDCEGPGIGRTVGHGVVECGVMLQLGAAHQLDPLIDHPFVGRKKVPPGEGDPSRQGE